MNVNPIKRFFESKAMQKFYKKACDPKNVDFWNNTLPLIETSTCTAFYMLNTETQKDLPRDQKNILQYQNILNCVAGVWLGGMFNKKVTKFINKLTPKLNKDLIKDVHKVEAGVKILGPTVIMAMLMRVISPTVTAFVSTKIEDKRRENKLDIKA